MLLSLGMLMLSATQIYTIFTVQLFAFLNLLPVEADIAAVSRSMPTHRSSVRVLGFRVSAVSKKPSFPLF